MAALSPFYTSTTNSSIMGTSYRIDSWPITTTANTCPIGWNNAASTTVQTNVQTNVIQFRTLSMPTTWQYTTGYQTGTVYWTSGTITGTVLAALKTPAQRLREILNSRMAPGILTTCRPLGYTEDVREMRARETLRRVLGEDRFRDFIRRGSISVRAKSGLVYQIFPGHDMTKVYDCGKLKERLCVVLNGGFPPTDSLIMRYLMILNNEQQFKSYAIKHAVHQEVYCPVSPDQRSLAEIFKELKKAA